MKNARTWGQTDCLHFDLPLVLDRDLRRWQLTRQRVVVALPATLNRALASLRAFFTWDQQAGLIQHNPTTELHSLPNEETAPRSMPPSGLDWLIRVISQQDPTVRLRDLALLTLLSDCGLRSQEAADVQLRDLDLDAAALTMRSGKGRKARRVLLTEQAIRTLRAYLKVRCPAGLLPIGSEAEREALLMKHNVKKAGASWEPGVTTVAMRTHLAELRGAAVALIQEHAAKEPSLERVAQLEALARQVALVSPHQLRHGLADRLWKTATPAAIMQILGHSRVATTLTYGKPTEDDLRAALEDASRIR